MGCYLKLALLFLLSSCSTSAKEWGDWQSQAKPSHERVWRFCNTEQDGSELDKKGFCYSFDVCRARKTILGNKKTECKVNRDVCLWGDVTCLMEKNILPMKISN